MTANKCSFRIQLTLNQLLCKDQWLINLYSAFMKVLQENMTENQATQVQDETTDAD